MARTVWTESETRGVANDTQDVAHIRIQDDTVSLWMVPRRATANEIRRAGRLPGLVVLLRMPRIWSPPAHLAGEHVLLFQTVDNLERALFDTEYALGNLYDHFSPFLTGDLDHIVIGYTPDASHLHQALLILAVRRNIHQCLEDHDLLQDFVRDHSDSGAQPAA